MIESLGKRESVGKCDEAVNEDNKSSTTRSIRTVLTDSDVVWEEVGWQVLD